MSDQLHVVVMGVSGSGKTTIAELLAERLKWPFADADVFHPQSNIDKMESGTPLTDEDRWPWLRAMRDWLSEQAAAGHNAIVTCSALRRVYRDVLREADGRVLFVHLAGEPELVQERVLHRTGHFMPPDLLPSQYRTLEQLADDEDGIVISVDATPEQITDKVIDQLGLHP